MDINNNILERFSIPTEGTAVFTPIQMADELNPILETVKTIFENAIAREQNSLSDFTKNDLKTDAERQASSILEKQKTLENTQGIQPLFEGIKNKLAEKSKIETSIGNSIFNLSDKATCLINQRRIEIENAENTIQDCENENRESTQGIKNTQKRILELNTEIVNLTKELSLYASPIDRPWHHMLLDLFFGLGLLISWFVKNGIKNSIKSCETKIEDCKNNIAVYNEMTEANNLKIKEQNNYIEEYEQTILKTQENIKTSQKEYPEQIKNLKNIADELVTLQEQINEADTTEKVLSFQIAQRLNILIKEGSGDFCFYKIGEETISSDANNIFRGKTIQEISQIISPSQKNPEIHSLQANQKTLEQAREDLNNNKLETAAIKAVLCWDAILTSITTLDPTLSKLDRYHLVSILGKADCLNSSTQFALELATKGITQTSNAEEPTVITKEDGEIHIRSKFFLKVEGSDPSDYTMDINLNKKTYNIFENNIK